MATAVTHASNQMGYFNMSFMLNMTLSSCYDITYRLSVVTPVKSTMSIFLILDRLEICITSFEIKSDIFQILISFKTRKYKEISNKTVTS